MKKSKLLDKVPISSENPLLGAKEFFKYCKSRFVNIGKFENEFFWLLDFYKREKFLLPIYSEKGTDYYSSFQVYTLYLLEKYRSFSLKPRIAIKHKGKTIKSSIVDWQAVLRINAGDLRGQTSNFNKLLLLLLKIQDFYLPEVRTDKRVGEVRDYGGDVAIEATYFVKKTRVLLSEIREWRKRLIKDGSFDPKNILSDSGLKIAAIKDWTIRLAAALKDLDPLSEWHMLVQYTDYSKRQKLKNGALLAQDLYEIVGMLFLFLNDLGEDLSAQGVSDVYEWFDGSGRDKESKLPHWKERKYGTENLSNPYQMLEFLDNEFRVNPKPNAIVFTEGAEWKAIKKLFSFYKYNPELLGVEFRALGRDKFSYKKWVQFVEYMHEKQVYIFFLLDNENNARQAKNSFSNAFKKKKRLSQHPYLTAQLNPARIKIWGERKKNSSFEEANFTDAEIAKAIKKHGFSVSAAEIGSIRTSASRTKGLIEAIVDQHNIRLGKPQLDIDLINILIAKRKSRPSGKTKTQLEKFVIKIGEMVLLNHQPTGKNHQEMNLKIFAG